MNVSIQKSVKNTLLITTIGLITFGCKKQPNITPKPASKNDTHTTVSSANTETLLIAIYEANPSDERILGVTFKTSFIVARDNNSHEIIIYPQSATYDNYLLVDDHGTFSRYPRESQSSGRIPTGLKNGIVIWKNETEKVYDDRQKPLFIIDGTWKWDVSSAQLEIKECKGEIVIDNTKAPGAALNHTWGFSPTKYKIVANNKSYEFDTKKQMELRTPTKLKGKAIKIFENDKLIFDNTSIHTIYTIKGNFMTSIPTKYQTIFHIQTNSDKEIIIKNESTLENYVMGGLSPAHVPANYYLIEDENGRKHPFITKIDGPAIIKTNLRGKIKIFDKANKLIFSQL